MIMGKRIPTESLDVAREIKFNKLGFESQPTWSDILPQLIEKAKLYDELKAKIETLPRFRDNWQGIDLDPTGDLLDREEVLNLFK